MFSFPKDGPIRFQGSLIVNDPFTKALSEKAAQLGHHGVQEKSFDQVNSAPSINPALLGFSLTIHVFSLIMKIGL